MQAITIITTNLNNAENVAAAAVSYSQNNVLSICAICFVVAAVVGIAFKKYAM